MYHYYKKFKMIWAGMLCAATVAVLMSFSTEVPYVPCTTVITTYTRELNDAVMALDKAALEFKNGKLSLDALQKTLAATRISYKKIEFFLAFHYTEYSNEHFNGAPLLHIERSGTSPLVLQPEGLQVLDELIFSESAESEKAQIAALAKKLATNYKSLYASLPLTAVAGNESISAMRLQLVRIFTLGITGFDTPGSLNAIEEAAASLEGMQAFFAESYPGDTSLPALSLFNAAITHLQAANSFEALDRLEFLKNYIDPLYKELGKLGPSQNSESLQQASAWNPGSNSVFGNDFLNPYFFSALKKEEDSEALRALGKTLFYDPVLSGGTTISCASCHQPDKAFTDGVSRSLSSIQGKTVLRNAPTLLNAVYADRYFYDLRAFTLEQQAEHVIFNPDEFNTAYSAIIKKLAGSPAYAARFKKAFGKGPVTREKFTKALASYVISLRSFNSPFDKYARGESASLDQEAKNGFNLFMGKANCATCHFAPTFAGLVPPFYSDNESEILGILADPKSKTPKQDTDEGRWANTIVSEYAWIYEKSFKTSTIRNAGTTAPYFHNGAYSTLEEVIDFYDNGGGRGLGLPVSNQTLPPDALNLTDTEKKELIAFINSLNDNPFAN
jgi:cytochrome c peroxidase